MSDRAEQDRNWPRLGHITLHEKKKTTMIDTVTVVIIPFTPPLLFKELGCLFGE